MTPEILARIVKGAAWAHDAECALDEADPWTWSFELPCEGRALAWRSTFSHAEDGWHISSDAPIDTYGVDEALTHARFLQDLSRRFAEEMIRFPDGESLLRYLVDTLGGERVDDDVIVPFEGGGEGWVGPLELGGETWVSCVVDVVNVEAIDERAALERNAMLGTIKLEVSDDGICRLAWSYPLCDLTALRLSELLGDAESERLTLLRELGIEADDASDEEDEDEPVSEEFDEQDADEDDEDADADDDDEEEEER